MSDMTCFSQLGQFVQLYVILVSVRDVRPWPCSWHLGLGLTALQSQGRGRYQWATVP